MLEKFTEKVNTEEQGVCVCVGGGGQAGESFGQLEADIYYHMMFSMKPLKLGIYRSKESSGWKSPGSHHAFTQHILKYNT